MTAVVSPSETTMELRVPLAVDQWRAQQGLPPLDVSKFEYRPRPNRPGCHRLEEWRGLMRMPNNYPFEPTIVHELHADLEYDEYGVVVLPEKKNSAFRRHAARHSAAS